MVENVLYNTFVCIIAPPAGYLNQQKLVDAARSFCQTSPYLHEEWNYMRQNLPIYSMVEDSQLVDNLREHRLIRIAGSIIK